jgi:CheY-like chemotaxis protein
VLLIDDDPAARYVLRRQFDSDWRVLEAANGAEGLRLARLERPSVIFLDLVMPGLSGAAVLQGLRADPSTIAIPVIIATSQHLQPAEQAELTANAATLFPKELLSSEHAATHVRDALARAGVGYSSSASSTAAPSGVNPIGR